MSARRKAASCFSRLVADALLIASGALAHAQEPGLLSQDHEEAQREPATAPSGMPPEHKMQHDHGAAAEPSHNPQDDTSSEARHVPPEPPQHPMPVMPYAEMARMMQMDDTKRAGTILLDQFEWRRADQSDAGIWEIEGWYGGDYNKLWIKTEGERVHSSTEDARVEVFWNRIISRWWSLQAGAREDFGEGPSRTWAAAGVQGLAPYWFNVEATLYLGEEDRTAARFKVEYDVLLTQRLILQPEVEANLYGKSDPDRQIGSGLSDLQVGLRLRYEFRRELAPYVGISWIRRFGETADLVRASGGEPNDIGLVLGIRAWL